MRTTASGVSQVQDLQDMFQGACQRRQDTGRKENKLVN